MAAWKVSWLGVTCANKTHLKVATLSRENGITVKVPAMETHLWKNRVHLIKHPKFGRYTEGGNNEFTQLHINNTLHWPLQGHFLNHTTNLWFANRQLWLKTTKTELPFLLNFTLPPTGAWLRSVQNTGMSLLKMTQSASLHGAVCTFNDRGVFTFQAGEEQDGKGPDDWQSTKDKHKPVKSGTKYSNVIYSLTATNQSISLFGHKHTENCFNKQACKGLCCYLESHPDVESKPQTFAKATCWSGSINHSQLARTRGLRSNPSPLVTHDWGRKHSHLIHIKETYIWLHYPGCSCASRYT